MNDPVAPSDDALTRGLDALHVLICRAQRDLFLLVAEADRRRLWEGDGARDMAHWLWMRYGISDWKAQRWIGASHRLEVLPSTTEAFVAGRVGIDKVVELCRYVTPESEDQVLPWAERVSAGAIRRKADVALERGTTDAADADSARSLRWWTFDEGRRFGLQAELPAAAGAVVARALERVAADVPVMPGEEGSRSSESRNADALVALASSRLSEDGDLERSTVVVHVPAEVAAWGRGGAEVEGGGVVSGSTVQRLLCSGRVQTVVEDASGNVAALGSTHRDPPTWMMRQLRHRDRECRFPGCGARRYVRAHHIKWWADSGPTRLDNLVLVCGFHHKLVHEHGWMIKRDSGGDIQWFRPDGGRYRAGPAPPSLLGGGP